VRIVVADDHPLLRQALRQVIDGASGLDLVGEAADGAEALAAIRKLRPDIAILDIDMPKMDGFAVARALRAESLDVEVMFLTVHHDPAFLRGAPGLGARGYILKNTPVSATPPGTRAVAPGCHYTSPAVTSVLVAGKRDERPGAG